MLKIFFFVCFLLACTVPVTSQNKTPVIAWQKCLGGTGAETFSQILEHPDGGIVVLGASNSNDGDVSGNHGGSDIWVVKLNKDGVIEWQKCLGGSGNEASAKMMLIPDGGVFVYGAINSNNGDGTGNHGGTDGFAARLSGNGTLLWAKCMGGSAFDTFSEAIRTASGNYLLAGITSSNDGDVSGNHGGNDIWLVELTISGSLVWQKCYGGSDTEQLANIERVNNSGYLICGTTNSTNGDVNGYTDGTDAWVVRTNTGGNLVWQKCYDNPTTLNFPYDVGQKILYTGGQYVFVYSHMEEYNYDYSSNKQKLHRTYAADLDPDNGALSGITLLNPNSILITSLETDWFPAKRIRKKKGGGLLLANDTRYCLVRDDYYWGFFLGEDDYYAQSFTKTVNTPGVQAQQLARLFGHCPTGWLPNVTYYGSYKSEDAVSYDENIMLHSGYTNLVTRPAEIKYGGNDAVVGIGLNNISHWGGSGDDRFLELLPSGENFFYAAGFTNSANGHVVGNHGSSDEIWLVKFAFRHVTIKGAVFNDLNGNGIKETNEPLLNNQAVKTEKPGTQMISFTQNGSFTHLADTGTYTTKIQNTYPYATFNPPQKNSALITYNSADSFGLGIRFIPNIKDLQVYVSALTPLRPGFNATYRLNYKNFGTDSVTDTRVQFVKDPRTGLVSTTMPGYVQNGDTLLWNTGTLQPGYENYIDIIVSVAAPPTVQINDTLSTQAQVLPIAGDTIPADNYMLNRLVVRGSYDPNDKTNQHAGEVSKAYLVNGGYVYYRIRFQNTGTDTAFTVKITDTLSTELDVNKLEMLEASHNYSLTINNRVGTWKFNSILLPDSFSNPAASNGYILFRIKPLASSISPGRLYRNSAGIYFDYNEAVRTPVDSLKIENVRKPVMAGLNNRYCKTPGGPYTGKLMNPLPGYTINVWLDNSQPLLYNPADSTFSFNTSTLSAGAHKIKSVYAVPDFGIDSTEHAFLLDEQLVPVIYKNDTVVCANAYVQLYTSMPVSNWLGGPVFNPQSPYGFFATVSSPDTTLLIAVKNNNSCAEGRDSVRIIVNRFLQPVILTNDTSVCNTSPPFPLLANSAVTWSGNGVTGNLFNPAVAGVGTHKVYATRDNGLCAPGRDSMFISVGNFAQVVINTPNQTMCSTGSLLLSANISATWSGIGVTGNYFEPFGLPPATYTIIATHSNAPCTASYDTLYVTTSPPVQVVIQNRDTAICTQSPPIILIANTSVGVSWFGPGVTGNLGANYSFNPATAGPGIHRVVAVWALPGCPPNYDTLYVTVNNYVQAVIATPNQTVCKLSAPISLQANTTVSWSGTGVAGSTFNPATAGVGVHQIIATKTNGVCPDSKDTLTITVDDFVQAVIATPNQTVCKLSAPISLQANTAVTWSGTGVAGATFNPTTAGAGTHQIIATKNNGVCPDSKDTLTITVDDFVQAVISTLNQTICKLSAPISLQANTTGVVWTGNGVSGATFNPAAAGVGVHQIIATKTNGSCPVSKDTLAITVGDFVQAIITTPNQTICKLSAPISLQANTTVSWGGTGVTGSTFNPATAGVGVHQIIATKTNGVCPDSKDTLTITVDDFVQAVIATPDQTICTLSAPISLQANTAVSWSGTGVTGSTFNPATAGVGTHQIIATKTNGVCPDSKDTLTITVDDFVQAVISTPDQTICTLSAPISLQANTNVSWVGTGVTGSTFNPGTAGAGVHQIIATKTNGVCPDSKDTLTITVDDFVQAVISTPDQIICKLSAPISLQANTTVTWSGTGVTGATFNPATAGVGVHQIIATKNNGACPETKDTLTITVDDFVQPVILNNDTTVCILGTAFNLRADMAVSWNGPGVTGSSFNPATAGAGTHLLFATRANGACPNGRDTLLVTVTPALTPDVQITASQNTLASVSAFSNLLATNAVGGGSNPLFTFAKDRNFTQVLQAESAVNTLRIVPQMLTVGVNTLYVRMRSNENCVTATTAIDSIQLTLNVSTPSKSELEQALKVFPNPNNGQFGFRFETGINDRVLVTVFDAVGKQVFKQDHGLVQQYNFGKPLDLRNRHAGRYTMQFRVGNIVITRKVNVLR